MTKLKHFPIFATLPVLGQGFVNLTFDDPDLSGPLVPIAPTIPGSPLIGNESQILRGWTLTANGTAIDKVNFAAAGAEVGNTVALLYGNHPSLAPFGAYSLYLDSGPGPDGFNVMLGQHGKIPGGALGLSAFSGGGVELLINGNKMWDFLTSRTIEIS
jgi:hypothetical protein